MEILTINFRKIVYKIPGQAMALASIHLAIIAIAAAVFVAAAITDANSYRIPNYLSVLLLLFYPVFVLTAPHSFDWRQSLAIFALVSACGFLMFLCHLIGAGDVKLLAAASLWAGPHWIAVLVVVTAIAGGALAVAMAALTYLRQKKKRAAKSLQKVPIPYGVAIGTGGLAILAMMIQEILLPV